MAQYNELKAKYADAILLFRVGDFYETFSTDAIKASKVLGIILTARNNGGSKVELAGFPHHSLDTYLPKLVQAGFRVAICEQLEKPSKHKKLVKRGVTEIVTPGITTNEKILHHKKNNFLAAVHFGKKGRIGLSFIDISTGEFLVSEGTATYIDKLLQSFQPSELIFSKSKQKDVLKYFGDKFYQYGIEEWVFTEDYAAEKLQQQFEVKSLKGFGVDDMHVAKVAAGAVLHYIASTEHNNLLHLNRISRIQADHYVWLDKFTVRNLELVYTQSPNGVPLIDILDQTISPMGTRLLNKWILLPLKDLKKVKERHQVVRYFMDNSSFTESITEQIKSIGDLERLIAKVPMNKINPREVMQLCRALHAIEPIKKHLSTTDNHQLQVIADELLLCEPLQERIDRELQENPPVKLDKGAVIADGVSSELDELRDIINNSKDHLLSIQQSEAAATGIDNLKIGFNNVFGYYLEVTNKYKNKGLVPEHWVRKQTLTNAERYITDELKHLEVKILGAEEKALGLEQQLFIDLVWSLQDYIRPVQKNAALIAQLDCLSAFANIATQNNYCRPQMNDSLVIDIKEGRHPVIEKQLNLGDVYVPNDLYLDNETQQIIMITGPNMSGKSALLRQTALICLMAQIGSFVPAKEATLGMIDKIFTRVGASDNISSGESTFMVEMNETASILNNISPRSLILLDEIGRGTSTYDGISIAWSISEFLHNNPEAQPKTLFATHYHELNELAERFDRIKNFNVSTKELNNKVIFLRKLKEGGSKHSFGIHVAKMAGMPRTVVERSGEILKELEQKSIDAGDLDQKVRQLSSPVQLSFFDSAADPKLTAVQELLEDIDPNQLTPIECMLKLDELKKMLD